MENISEVLKQNNFEFKKQLGQNFLSDKNLLKAIVADAGITSEDEVLEIGPGAGNLTVELAKVAKKVICYEIDKKLEPILKETLKEFSNVKVIYKDILNEEIESIKAQFSSSFKVVANLPYYITTPIIFMLLENNFNLSSITIMVQKEVAQRIVAKAGTKEYGTITVSANVKCDAKITRIVGKQMFYPMPSVDSAILHLTLNENKFKIISEEMLEKVIKSAFAMRRKILLNNFKKSFTISDEDLKAIFKKYNLKEDIRGETLTVEQFVLIANEFTHYEK